MILWLWMILAALVVVVGVRHLALVRGATRRGEPPRVDDAALKRIIETGTLGDADEPLDMDEAAEAEREFWSETWDEPEEYHR